LGGYGVNHSPAIAVACSLSLSLSPRGVICADALAAKAANGGKAGGVGEAKCFVWVCHGVSPLLCIPYRKYATQWQALSLLFLVFNLRAGKRDGEGDGLAP
jgi:hypothetical protein